jgi:hypothetical protein
MRWAVIVYLIVGVCAGAAADAWARQVKESSAEAKAAFERGRAAHNAGKTDEAVSSFERAVALDPTSSLYHLWLGHAYSRQRIARRRIGRMVTHHEVPHNGRLPSIDGRRAMASSVCRWSKPPRAGSRRRSES